MAPEDIKEGQCYVRAGLPSYYRCVEMIIDSAARPGGRVVAWSTDGFQVKRRNGDSRGKTHGKCGIATFARWATGILEDSQ